MFLEQLASVQSSLFKLHPEKILQQLPSRQVPKEAFIPYETLHSMSKGQSSQFFCDVLSFSCSSCICTCIKFWLPYLLLLFYFNSLCLFLLSLCFPLHIAFLFFFAFFLPLRFFFSLIHLFFPYSMS